MDMDYPSGSGNSNYNYCLLCCDNVTRFRQDPVYIISENVIVKDDQVERDSEEDNGGGEPFLTNPSLTQILHCFLNLFSIKSTSNLKQKTLEWEKVFPYCVNCKSQLISLLNLRKQVEELEKEIKEKVIRSEEIFELVGVYNEENSYHEIRSKILRKDPRLSKKHIAPPAPAPATTVVNLRRSPRKARESARMYETRSSNQITDDEFPCEINLEEPEVEFVTFLDDHNEKDTNESLEDPLAPTKLMEDEEFPETVSVQDINKRIRTATELKQTQLRATTKKSDKPRQRRLPKGVPNPAATTDTYTYRNVTLTKVGDGSVFACTLCSSVLKNRKEIFQRHIAFFHTDLFICSYPGCGVKVSSKRNLDRHARLHLEKRKVMKFKTRTPRKVGEAIRIRICEDSSSNLRAVSEDEVPSENNTVVRTTAEVDFFLQKPIKKDVEEESLETFADPLAHSTSQEAEELPEEAISLQDKKRVGGSKSTEKESKRTKQQTTLEKLSQRRPYRFRKEGAKPSWTFVTEETFTYHNITLTKLGNGSTFSCNTCSAVLRNSKSMFERHVAFYHTNLFVCSYPGCGLKVSSKRNLDRHYNLHLTKPKVLILKRTPGKIRKPITIPESSSSDDTTEEEEDDPLESEVVPEPGPLVDEGSSLDVPAEEPPEAVSVQDGIRRVRRTTAEQSKRIKQQATVKKLKKQRRHRIKKEVKWRKFHWDSVTDDTFTYENVTLTKVGDGSTYSCNSCYAVLRNSKSMFERHVSFHHTNLFVCSYPDCGLKVSSQRNLDRHARLHLEKRKVMKFKTRSPGEVLEPLISEISSADEISEDEEHPLKNKAVRETESEVGQDARIAPPTSVDVEKSSPGRPPVKKCKSRPDVERLQRLKQRRLEKKREQMRRYYHSHPKVVNPLKHVVTKDIYTYKNVSLSKVGDGSTYSCNLCSAVLKNNRYKLIQHVGFEHTNLFVCSFPGCGRKMSSNSSLEYHYRLHLTKDDDPTSCSCEVCGRPNLTQKQLNIHKLTHFSEEEYKYYEIARGDDPSPDPLAPSISVDADQYPAGWRTLAKIIDNSTLNTAYPLKDAVTKDTYTYKNVTLTKVGDGSTFSCNLCYAVLKNSGSTFQRHVALVHVDLFVCPFPDCGKKLSSDLSLRKHSRLHLTKVLVKDDGYPCEICGRPYVTQNQVKIHKWTHYSEEDKYYEIALGNEPPNPQAIIDVEKHKQRHRSKFKTKVKGISEKPDRQERRKNPISKAMTAPPSAFILTDTVTYYNVTLTKLGDGSTFSCNLCSKELQNLSSVLERHVVRSHTSLYVCSFPGCGIRASCKASLQKHIRWHTDKDNPSYPCHICGRPFIDQRKVESHKWTHFSKEDKNEAIASGEKPPLHHLKTVQCDQCAYTCHTKFVLSIHQRRNHSTPEEREKYRVLCTVCGKKVMCINDHMETHGEKAINKLHVCAICGKRFAYDSGLARHKKQAHR
ncbi:unnamed protein product [Orchesella dallaii]|uniref:C2H2-type domain-containing protein n=1 Tax=Orchesella dallaii TaxID=48710 RepID=A0ABP1RGY5_9HEXA